MAIVNGTVEAISTKFGKFGICVEGKWYNTNPEWLSVKPEKGDVVEFDDGGRNYIKKLKVISGAVPSSTPSTSPKAPVSSSGGRTFPVGVTAPERTINRQNALTNAVALMSQYPVTEADDIMLNAQTVIDIARKFESYTTGDLDLEEAKAALEEMGA